MHLTKNTVRKSLWTSWWVPEISVTFGREKVGMIWWECIQASNSLKLSVTTGTLVMFARLTKIAAFFEDIEYHLSFVGEAFSLTLILRWDELHNHHARSLEILWMLRKGGGHGWFHVVSYLQSFQSDLTVRIIILSMLLPQTLLLEAELGAPFFPVKSVGRFGVPLGVWPYVASDAHLCPADFCCGRRWAHQGCS